jgi:hypothetical protein
VARRRRRGLVILGGLLGLALSPAAARSRTAILGRVERIRRRGGDPVSAFLEAPCHRDVAAAPHGESHEAEVVQ